MNEYFVKVNGNKKKVRLTSNGEIFLDEIKYDINLTRVGNNFYHMMLNNEVYEITSRELKDKYEVIIDGNYYETLVKTNLEMMADEYLSKKEKTSRHDEIKAPMPGLLLKIKKKEGDSVESGETVAVLEAMKMENNIRSSATGIVKQILLKEGNSVEKNEVILIIE